MSSRIFWKISYPKEGLHESDTEQTQNKVGKVPRYDSVTTMRKKLKYRCTSTVNKLAASSLSKRLHMLACEQNIDNIFITLTNDWIDNNNIFIRLTNDWIDYKELCI